MRRTAAAFALAVAPLWLGAQAPQAPQAAEPPLPLKHIRITPSGRIWLALGGQQRLRAERDVNYLGGGPGTRTDDFGLSRTTLSADLHLNPGLRLFIEARHATARGRDLPGGSRASDRDELDWATLYAETSRGMGDVRSTLRLGRQEILLGSERLVSPGDWSNVRRTFEGVVLNTVEGNHTLTAFYARPVIVRQTAANDVDQRVVFWGVQGAWRRVNSPATLELYGLDRTTDPGSGAPRASRTTVGARAVTPIPWTRWQAEVEGAWQFGTTGTDRVRAAMIASNLSRAFKVRWAPQLTLGADWSSGTDAGQGALSRTFDPLYALGHSHLGYADVLGRRNIIELRGVVQASPASALRLRASAHAFRRASSGDAIYDTGGNVFRATVSGAPMRAGDELDLTASWRVSRFLKVDAGGARFAPGGFMRATGAARPYSWGFASITATY